MLWTSVKSSLPVFLNYNLLPQTQCGSPIPPQTTFPTPTTLWLQFPTHSDVGWSSTKLLLCPSLNISKTTPNCLQDQVQTRHDFQSQFGNNLHYLALFFAKFHPVFYVPNFLNPNISSLMTFCSYLSKCCSLHLILAWFHRTQLRYFLPSPLPVYLAMLPLETSTAFCTHYSCLI